MFAALHPVADFICMVSETEKRCKTGCIFYWGCILPTLFLRCRHNCECFDFFNSVAFILFSTKNHPVYSALFGAFSLGILSTIGAFIGLKYAMKKRPGKENALIFGVGMGGFESILNGATVYITNIIAALLINSIGSTEYFKKLALKGEELAQTQKLFTEQAATPSSSFFMDATYVILSLVLYAAIAILVEYAISTGEKQWTVIAIVLHVAGYVPIYLRNIDIYKSSMTLFVIATVFTFAIALFAYQIYHRTENGKK